MVTIAIGMEDLIGRVFNWTCCESFVLCLVLFCLFSFQQDRHDATNETSLLLIGLDGLPPKIQITVGQPIPLKCEFK